MESTIFDSLNMMDTTPVSPEAAQFLPGSIQIPPTVPTMPDSFAGFPPDASMQMPMLTPAPYIPAPIAAFNDYQPQPQTQYPLMDQSPDMDLLSRAPTQISPPAAAIHPVPASYALNPASSSSLASALDPGAVLPASRSRANTLSSQPPPPFIPVVSAAFPPPVTGEIQVKQEDTLKERVVGNMFRNMAHVMKTAGDACHLNQATRPITPSDEQKTRQLFVQINDFIQGMGLPTTTTSHVENCRKRHAGEMNGEQPPVKKILKPEPEDVNLSALPLTSAVAPMPSTFVRTHTSSRSQPSSRPHTPPLNLKPLPSSTFRPVFPPFNVSNPPLDNSHRFSHSNRHHHSRSMGSIPREAHGFNPSSAPAGRMGRNGYFSPEHGWKTQGVSPKSAPSLTTFTYPNPMESLTPVSTLPTTATDIVDEEDEDHDGDTDEVDTFSPSGSSNHSYTESGVSSGSDIPTEYRAEVDRLFLAYLNRICSNLDATDNKGDPIHQQLMAKKMQKLDESTDFRPFKFRIQAFTAAFLEELAENGYPEEKIPMKKVRNYLWRQPLILRFNEDGKKAKSKGNHIWNVEARKLGGDGWEFRPFVRKIAGSPPPVAYCGILWTWRPRVWDPQACWHNIPVQYSSPSLPPWLQWKDDVLSGTPPPNAESCEITVHAKFTLDGQDGLLTRTFFLNIAPPAVVSTDPSFPPFSQRPSIITPRRTVSDSTIPAWATPRTVPLVTDEEDEARVKMVLEQVAERLTQEMLPPGQLGVQQSLLEQTVNACLDDVEEAEKAPEKSHELAVAGQNVVAQAAEYIVRKAAPGAVLLPSNSSAMQNVNTEELVQTTTVAIAQAVLNETNNKGSSDIDELSVLLVACRVLDGAFRPQQTQQRWVDQPVPAHLPPQSDWYVPAYV